MPTILKFKQTEEQKVWLTSDSHFHHKNIVAGQTSWVKLPILYLEWLKINPKALYKFCLENGIRPFPTVEEMDNTIIENINKYVRPNDILIHAGDWSFGSSDNIKHFRNLIKCQNIHLILGNHDKGIQQKMESSDIKYCFQTISDLIWLYVDDYFVSITHYAYRTWNRSHRDNSFAAYGHSHGQLEHTPWGKSMDIGIDNAFSKFGEFRPFSFEEFHNFVKDKQIIKHHENKDH